ncbi:hypothetical protein wTkk_000825 [Wolbachia endosymbiont of Trichogramma kaykai]
MQAITFITIITHPISNIQGGPCPLLVIQVADTDSPYDGVIPVLRHWDPVKFASIKVINVSYDGKMDSSVTHCNDTKGATRMTSSATYLDHKRRILKRKA